MSDPARRRMFLKFLKNLVLVFLSLGVAWLGVHAGFGSLGFPVGWVRGLAEMWTALFLGFVGALAVGRWAGRRQQDPFGRINEALQRISRGDFSVPFPAPEANHDPDNRLRSLTENLNAMTESLARMEELRRQFVADVSHEFQSPLTSILGFAQALRSADLPPELRERYLGIIGTEARRLSRLSETLLRLNGLEDRKGPPNPELFRMDVQIRRVLVALEPQWSAKSLAVEADLAEAELRGDEELWNQVWTNLIHNAIKFTPSGGRIGVRLTGSGPWTVDVSDSGIGLAEEDRVRVFERFYKVDAARSRGEGGSGLGLALVERVVTLHGAEVEALSAGLGQGTTVRVRIPAPAS